MVSAIYSPVILIKVVPYIYTWPNCRSSGMVDRSTYWDVERLLTHLSKCWPLKAVDKSTDWSMESWLLSMLELSTFWRRWQVDILRCGKVANILINVSMFRSSWIQYIWTVHSEFALELFWTSVELEELNVSTCQLFQEVDTLTNILFPLSWLNMSTCQLLQKVDTLTNMLPSI